jgi:signal peptidase II
MHRAVLVIITGMTIGCDQGTKYIAAAVLADRPAQSFFADIFRLLYVENTGGFLGLGATLPSPLRTALFTVVTGGVLALFAVGLFRSKWSPWRMAGLTLFVAGGASNWIDRVLRGSVVDFMNIGIGWMRTGIFNVADVAIMAGIALFLLPEFRKRIIPTGDSKALP